MGTAAAWRRAVLDRGVLASLLLHVLLGAVLAFLPVPRMPEPPLERSIEVEIIEAPRPPPLVSSPPVAPSLPSAPAEPSPSPLPPSESEPVPAVPDAGPPSLSPAMVTPTRMLSAKTLADPRSREARQTLRLLAGDERIEQLCGIEAMAQVAAWQRAFEPDRLIAYAMSDTKISGNTLVADGAAFHSKRQWFNIRFRCGLAPDRRKVVAFAFAVGEAVPRREWSSHSLPVEDGPSD